MHIRPYPLKNDYIFMVSSQGNELSNNVEEKGLLSRICYFIIYYEINKNYYDFSWFFSRWRIHTNTWHIRAEIARAMPVAIMNILEGWTGSNQSFNSIFDLPPNMKEQY